MGKSFVSGKCRAVDNDESNRKEMMSTKRLKEDSRKGNEDTINIKEATDGIKSLGMLDHVNNPKISQFCTLKRKKSGGNSKTRKDKDDDHDNYLSSPGNYHFKLPKGVALYRQSQYRHEQIKYFLEWCDKYGGNEFDISMLPFKLELSGQNAKSVKEELENLNERRQTNKMRKKERLSKISTRIT